MVFGCVLSGEMMRWVSVSNDSCARWTTLSTEMSASALRHLAEEEERSALSRGVASRIPRFERVDNSSYSGSYGSSATPHRTMKDLVIDPSGIIHSLNNKLHHLVSSLTARSPRRRILNVLLLPVLCIAFFLLFPLRPPLPPSYADEYALERQVMSDVRQPEALEAVDGRFVR